MALVVSATMPLLVAAEGFQAKIKVEWLVALRGLIAHQCCPAAPCAEACLWHALPRPAFFQMGQQELDRSALASSDAVAVEAVGSIKAVAAFNMQARRRSALVPSCTPLARLGLL